MVKRYLILGFLLPLPLYIHLCVALNVSVGLNATMVNPYEKVSVSGHVVNSSGKVVGRVPLHFKLDGGLAEMVGDGGYLKGENGLWKFWRSINVSGGSVDVWNYTIRVVVDTSSLISAGKMRSDCGDIRFVDRSGKLLDYWVESGCGSVSTVIWVKVPFISASKGTEIFMVYGNANATSRSNASAVFVFYDDFDDGLLDGWSLSHDCGNAWNEVSTAYYSSHPYSMEVRARAGWFSSCQALSQHSIYLDGGNYELVFKYRNDAPGFLSTVNTVVNVDGNVVFSQSYSGAGLYGGVAKFSVSSGYHSVGLGLTISVFFSSAYSSYFDDVFLRKVVDVEPAVVSIGSESVFTTTDDAGKYNYSFIAPRDAGTHVLSVEVWDENGDYGWNESGFVVRIGIENASGIFLAGSATSSPLSAVKADPRINISCYVYRNRDADISSVWVEMISPSNEHAVVYLENTSSRNSEGWWHSLISIDSLFSEIVPGSYLLIFHASSTLSNGSELREVVPAPTAKLNVVSYNVNVCVSNEERYFWNDCIANKVDVFGLEDTIYLLIVVENNSQRTSGLSINSFVFKDNDVNVSQLFRINLREVDAGVYSTHIPSSSLGGGTHILRVEVWNNSLLYGFNETLITIASGVKMTVGNITISIEGNFNSTTKTECGVIGVINTSIAGIDFCSGIHIFGSNGSNFIKSVDDIKNHKVYVIFTNDNEKRVVERLGWTRSGMFESENANFGYNLKDYWILRIILTLPENMRIDNRFILHEGKHLLQLLNRGFLFNATHITVTQK